jgi:type I restriction enzyme R subunit
LQANIFGNREFPEHLRNSCKSFCAPRNRDMDLALIDYRDPLVNNVFELTGPSISITTSTETPRMWLF